MPVTFKSQATGDLLMLNDSAEALLQCLGKTSKEPGIIEPQDMVHALAVLKALPDAPEPADVEQSIQEAGGKVEAPELRFADEFVSLRHRAVPLIRMIEQALSEQKPIVWGV